MENESIRQFVKEEKLWYGALKKKKLAGEEVNALQTLLDENKPLPKNILCRRSEFGGKSVFYELEQNVTEEEFEIYLKMLQTIYLRTIKNCTLFFTVVSIIGAILYLIVLLFPA